MNDFHLGIVEDFLEINYYKTKYYRLPLCQKELFRSTSIIYFDIDKVVGFYEYKLTIQTLQPSNRNHFPNGTDEVIAMRTERKFTFSSSQRFLTHHQVTSIKLILPVIHLK